MPPGTDLKLNKMKLTEKEDTENQKDPEKCNVCKTIFENSLRSQHRKLIDQCGHAICFNCLISSAICSICFEDKKEDPKPETPEKINLQTKDLIEDTPPDKIIEESTSYNCESPILNKRPSKTTEFEIRPLNTKNSEKLFKFGEEIVHSNQKYKHRE